MQRSNIFIDFIDSHQKAAGRKLTSQSMFRFVCSLPGCARGLTKSVVDQILHHEDAMEMACIHMHFQTRGGGCNNLAPDADTLHFTHADDGKFFL